MKGSNGKKGLWKGERHVKTCSKGGLPIPIKGVAKEDLNNPDLCSNSHVLLRYVYKPGE